VADLKRSAKKKMICDLPIEWLRQKGTVEEFESIELKRKATAFGLPFEKVASKFGARPFGDMTEKWRVFAKKKEEMDELWFFSSPEHMSAKKLGCQGFAIVRDGSIRETFVTLMT
jgi:hypothetical protein